MIDLLAGWLLVLAGGLMGADLLVVRQPTLKETLMHLQVYQESIGLFNLALGLMSVFHATSTATTHTYAPLYWLLYAGSALSATCVGATLSAHLLSARLSHGPEWLHRLLIYVSLWSKRYEAPLTWSSLTLGLWRALEPFFGT